MVCWLAVTGKRFRFAEVKLSSGAGVEFGVGTTASLVNS
jgi:hypothetical protein